MNHIGIYNESNKKLDELNELLELMEYALKYLKLEDVDFNIILVDEKKIHEMNREYRGIDNSTDVISFALEDLTDIQYEGYRLLGDIYICREKVLEQANNYDHSIKRELSFLAVHGLLHLLGYDHMEAEDEKVMFALQEKILDSFGITR